MKRILDKLKSCESNSLSTINLDGNSEPWFYIDHKQGHWYVCNRRCAFHLLTPPARDKARASCGWAACQRDSCPSWALPGRKRTTINVDNKNSLRIKRPKTWNWLWSSLLVRRKERNRVECAARACTSLMQHSKFWQVFQPRWKRGLPRRRCVPTQRPTFVQFPAFWCRWSVFVQTSSHGECVSSICSKCSQIIFSLLIKVMVL